MGMFFEAMRHLLKAPSDVKFITVPEKTARYDIPIISNPSVKVFGNFNPPVARVSFARETIALDFLVVSEGIEYLCGYGPNANVIAYRRVEKEPVQKVEGPIYSYKVLQASPVCYLSPLKGYEWFPKWMQADMGYNPSQIGGFYSFKNEMAARIHALERSDYICVKVQLAGTVYEHSRGYRSQYCRVVGVVGVSVRAYCAANYFDVPIDPKPELTLEVRIVDQKHVLRTGFPHVSWIVRAVGFLNGQAHEVDFSFPEQVDTHVLRAFFIERLAKKIEELDTNTPYANLQTL